MRIVQPPARPFFRRATPVWIMMIGLITMLILPAQSARANGFEPIRERAKFLSLVEGRALTHLGITLKVSRDGQIRGNALGRRVSGEWSWTNGYFCRSLFWGAKRFPDNCQWVGQRGDVIRFQSDRGRGEYADLTIR